MAETEIKKLKTRMVQKHGTFDEWSNATNFIPLLGELIVYTDGTGGETSPRIKIGDGERVVTELPFATSSSSGGTLEWNEF